MKARIHNLVGALVIGITTLGFLAALEPMIAGAEALSYLS